MDILLIYAIDRDGFHWLAMKDVIPRSILERTNQSIKLIIVRANGMSEWVDHYQGWLMSEINVANA